MLFDCFGAKLVHNETQHELGIRLDRVTGGDHAPRATRDRQHCLAKYMTSAVRKFTRKRATDGAYGL